MKLRQRDFLQSVRSLLLYHCSIGVEDYPATGDVIRFLESQGSVKQSCKVSRERLDTGPAAGTTAGAGDQIAVEVRSCTRCNLHLQRLSPVPGEGGYHPRVLFVGGWLSGEEGIRMPDGMVFGQEEDIMISRMLLAMKLPSEQAFITNIIKCAVPHACQPADENISACSSFLFRQIMDLSPEIICTMGSTPTRALLKNNQPLSRLRGKFYLFAVSGEKSIPLVPTYHPSFLLRNPELKRAAWEDLQDIAKYLKLQQSLKV
jgi:uracil-DNA glycosylase